jgi:hypothetical protein
VSEIEHGGTHSAFEEDSWGACIHNFSKTLQVMKHTWMQGVGFQQALIVRGRAVSPGEALARGSCAARLLQPPVRWITDESEPDRSSASTPNCTPIPITWTALNSPANTPGVYAGIAVTNSLFVGA